MCKKRINFPQSPIVHLSILTFYSLTLFHILILATNANYVGVLIAVQNFLAFCDVCSYKIQINKRLT